MVWTKITERFNRIAHSFRYFDINSNGKISLNEFSQGLEGLGVRLSPEETERVFNYLDKDSNGEVDYKEWCTMCEEKRREIDPFPAGDHLEQRGYSTLS